MFSNFQFGRICCLERTDFNQFSLLEYVVVLKELIVCNLPLELCGGTERTDFNNFHFEGMWCLERTNFG